jgi:hypothetical protein
MMRFKKSNSNSKLKSKTTYSSLFKTKKVSITLLRGWGSGFWVPGSGFWVLGSGFWVLGSGFRVCYVFDTSDFVLHTAKFHQPSHGRMQINPLQTQTQIQNQFQKMVIVY